jgi:hypothetical protein
MLINYKNNISMFFNMEATKKWVGMFDEMHKKGQLLEYNGCAHLNIDNIAILSPNHRPKPPPSTLTLTENHSGSKP